MLSKQRCPHTGIINYFARSEPFFSIGSIVRDEQRTGDYYWRVYSAAKTVSGIAADMTSAERRIEREYKAQKLLQ